MKDWRGNSESVRTRLAIGKDRTTKGREENDFYATDPSALDRLLASHSDFLRERLHFSMITGLPIVEPACGTGNLSDCLKRHNFNVISFDIQDRGYGDVQDFLKWENRNPIAEFDGYVIRGFISHVILTNPPYSLAAEFIEHAMEILPTGGIYVALMNICYLAGQTRYKRIYSNGYLREVYVFSKRVACYKNNEPSNGNTMADYCWYVFQKGYEGQPTLYWLP